MIELSLLFGGHPPAKPPQQPVVRGAQKTNEANNTNNTNKANQDLASWVANAFRIDQLSEVIMGSVVVLSPFAGTTAGLLSSLAFDGFVFKGYECLHGDPLPYWVRMSIVATCAGIGIYQGAKFGVSLAGYYFSQMEEAQKRKKLNQQRFEQAVRRLKKG